MVSEGYAQKWATARRIGDIQISENEEKRTDLSIHCRHSADLSSKAYY